MPNTVEGAFQARTDLISAYTQNARLLFALQLKYDIEDIHAVAREAIVDGRNDKGCDLVYFDRSGRRLIVAQGYEAQNAAEGTMAPANKAADLGKAINWILSGPLEGMNDLLQPIAREVRTAIQNGEIDEVQFWYVHNREGSKPCVDELKMVEQAARNALRDAAIFPNQAAIPSEVSAIEVGIDRQEEWYKSLATHILVSDEIIFEVPGFFEVAGDGWRSIITTVAAKQLRELYERHKSNLFSANYRDFLGTGRSRRTQDINSQMQRTATEEPGKFWVYNNGISAIVHEFKTETTAGVNRVVVKGLSIVNGAQTTGSLGSLASQPAGSTMVSIRFVHCDDEATIDNIIRFNNSQNPLIPADYRSNDEVQRRLREEFRNYPRAKYNGGRRGIPTDRIAPPGDLMPADTVAQALATFHQEPIIAYHDKASIWNDEETYRKFFSDKTSAPHIVFAYGLLKAVEELKKELRKGDNDGKLTANDQQLFEFLRVRGAPVLLASAVANCVEILAGRAIPNPWRVSFGPQVGPSKAIDYWLPVVRSIAAFHAQLAPSARNLLSDENQTRSSLKQFAATVLATRTLLAQVPEIKAFAERLVVA